MKKQILASGKALNKQEQKEINGGFGGASECWGEPYGNCENIAGCKWWNHCYCGPLDPHIAPC